VLNAKSLGKDQTKKRNKIGEIDENKIGEIMKKAWKVLLRIKEHRGWCSFEGGGDCNTPSLNLEYR
jgi:hypothetical protein